MLKEYRPRFLQTALKSLRLALAPYDGTWFGVLVDDEDRLVASAFSDDKTSVERQLTKWSQKKRLGEIQETKHSYAREMTKLFIGDHSSGEVDFVFEASTGFQEKVWSVLERIPYGRVTTYGLIARAINSGPRAVGQAVGSNPCPLFIPCHRVVPSDMTVGNYSMMGKHPEDNGNVKRALLEREGIRFLGDRIPLAALWTPH